MAGEADPPTVSTTTLPSKPRRPRHLRKRALDEEEEGGGSDGGNGDPAHAAAPGASPAALGDLKFLQKQRGRRTVRSPWWRIARIGA